MIGNVEPDLVIQISSSASCCQHFFDVTEAKCKSVIKPHSVTDNLDGIAISGINIGIFHFQIIAYF
jgi:hypothetical protein